MYDVFFETKDGDVRSKSFGNRQAAEQYADALDRDVTSILILNA